MGITYTKQPVKAVVSDVTGTRALDTDYVNNTGRPILVLVTATCLRVMGETVHAYIKGRVDAEDVGYAGLGKKTDLPEAAIVMLTYAVPNGSTYQTVSDVDTGCSATMNTWFEVEL